jgi:hypothetical protein
MREKPKYKSSSAIQAKNQRKKISIEEKLGDLQMVKKLLKQAIMLDSLTLVFIRIVYNTDRIRKSTKS